MNTEDLKRALMAKSKKPDTPVSSLLSSSSTLLNLAATGRIAGCFAKGHYYHFVGNSDSGKTWICLSALAEASINKHFDDYRLILDNGENGALMNMERFFGPKLAARLEPPVGTREEPEFSSTTEGFYFNLDDCLKRGEPFVYILDSMDVLDSEDDQKQFAKLKAVAKKRSKGKEVEATGSYGTAKSKVNSTNLRRVVGQLHKTGSILIIISQTRDKIGFGSKFDPNTVSGGRALKFYATLQIWSAQKEKIKKQIRSKRRQLGIISKVQVKKNRATGRDRTVEVPIYHSFGVDDLGSCVDYLLDEGYWKGTEGSLKAPEFEFSGRKEDLIAQIEEEGEERELRVLVGRVWNEIEDACKLKRKPRYQ